MRHSKFQRETGNGFDFVVVIALFALLYNYLRMVCIHHKHKLPEHFIISWTPHMLQPSYHSLVDASDPIYNWFSVPQIIFPSIAMSPSKTFPWVAHSKGLMREERGVCRTSVYALALRVCKETHLTMDGRGSLRVYPGFISMYVFVLHVVCQFVPR